MCGGIKHSNYQFLPEVDPEEKLLPPKKRKIEEVKHCHLPAADLIRQSKLQHPHPLTAKDVINCDILGNYKNTLVEKKFSTIKPEGVDLLPKTPSVLVESKGDAFSPELVNFCVQHPICVVRGLAPTCDLNLSLFSSKALVHTAPEYPVEIRTQHFKNPEENVPTHGHTNWDCYSVRSQTTVSKYVQYQATSYFNSLKEDVEECSTHTIRFGTNLDLSDEKQWSTQLQELHKLPPFLRVFSPGNMLSHVGHPILGMNTVQLYMKVKGSRTPGHQENNNFSAVNLNIGPGDCEWFGVADAYWEDIYHLLELKGLNFLKGSWWPDPEELAKAGIPLYRFTQKPGDLVWISPGCVHWVQSLGWCNNIAWNVGPMTHSQFRMALERYEWNKIQEFKSIVPMTHLAWNLARNVEIREPQFFQLVKSVLERTLLHSVKILDFARSLNVPVHFYGRGDNEASHYCEICEEEVFNTLFIKQEEVRHHVFCIKCSLQASPDLKGYACLQEYTLQDLGSIYDNFKLPI